MSFSVARRWLFIAAAGCAWAYVALWTVHTVVLSLQRFVLQSTRLSADDSWLLQLSAWLLGIAVVLGFAGAWDVARHSRPDYLGRSSLVAWPGWPIAAVSFLVAFVFSLFVGLGVQWTTMALFMTLGEEFWSSVALILAVAAAVAGGRGGNAAGLVAAPGLLLVCVALVRGDAIARLAAALMPAAILCAIGLGVLAAKTRALPPVWLALGFGLLAAAGNLLSTGLFTTLEVLAFACVLAAPLFVVLAIVQRGYLPRALAGGAADIIATFTALALPFLAWRTFAIMHGRAPQLLAWASAVPASALELALGAIAAAAAFFLTPVLGIVIVATVIGHSSQGLRLDAVLAMAAIAAFALRAAGRIAAAIVLGGLLLTLAAWSVIESVFVRF